MVQEKNIVRLGLTIILFIALLCLVITAAPALADGKGKYWHPRACSKTASAAFLACYSEKKDDYWIAQGNCYNLSDKEEQAECFAEAKEEYKEAKEECREQLEARKEVCELVGEAPYDPEIDPENFVDPTNIGTSVAANPYFPLVEGNTWEYEGGEETITVTVTAETKIILGVICRVVTDVVQEDGEVKEDTKDWFGQDIEGNVWYFGEISQEFENGELVSIDGSWTAGVDGAKPGIIMYFEPEVGDVYRQEFLLGDAEDWAKVVRLDADESAPAADCDGGCLQTEEGTPLESDVIENKFYKPGIGLILELNPETGERVELVNLTTP